MSTETGLLDKRLGLAPASADDWVSNNRHKSEAAVDSYVHIRSLVTCGTAPTFIWNLCLLQMPGYKKVCETWFSSVRGGRSSDGNQIWSPTSELWCIAA